MTSIPTIQPMSESLWVLFSGAVSFSDGTDPVFAELGPWMAIADAEGVQFHLAHEDGTTDTWSHSLNLTCQRDARIALEMNLRALLGVGLREEGLRLLGFEKIT